MPAVKAKAKVSKKAVWLAVAVTAAIVGYIVWKRHQAAAAAAQDQGGPPAATDTLGNAGSGSAGGSSGGAGLPPPPIGAHIFPPKTSGSGTPELQQFGGDVGIIQLQRKKFKAPHQKAAAAAGAAAASQDEPGAQSVAANSGYGLVDPSLLAPASRLHDAQTQAGSLVGSGVTLANPDGRYGPPGGGVDIGPDGQPVGHTGYSPGPTSNPVQSPPRFVHQGV